MHAFYARYIEALNTRELHRLDEFVSDEVTYFGDRVTRDQIFAAISSEIEAIPDLSWEVTDLSVHGDDLAARLVNRGTR